MLDRLVTHKGLETDRERDFSHNFVRKQVVVDIFDLGGRRLHQVCINEFGIGPAVCSWDGRLANGDLVVPGTYIWVLRIKADAFEERHTGTIAVTY